jgi:hypothetical protein
MEQRVLPDQLVYSVRTIGREVIHELLQMAGKIDNGRNVSGTEKRLSNCGPRSELHAFLKPGCTAIEEFVWQQAWEDAAHGTCQVRRQSTLTTSYLPKVAVSVPPPTPRPVWRSSIAASVTDRTRSA